MFILFFTIISLFFLMWTCFFMVNTVAIPAFVARNKSGIQSAEKGHSPGNCMS